MCGIKLSYYDSMVNNPKLNLPQIKNIKAHRKVQMQNSIEFQPYEILKHEIITKNIKVP